jgi:hypothetical protein
MFSEEKMEATERLLCTSCQLRAYHPNTVDMGHASVLSLAGIQANAWLNTDSISPSPHFVNQAFA